MLRLIGKAAGDQHPHRVTSADAASRPPIYRTRKTTMNVTLESLGISKEAIEQKLIEHLAENLLTEIQ